MNLWCIHGNLQLPSAWDFLDGKIVNSSTAFEKEYAVLHKEDLWSHQECSFDTWTRSFLDRVNRLHAQEKPWIMGYSLGGRLALHALLKEPNMWQGGIIVAAHPGLSNRQERREQRDRDVQWGRRFEVEPWDELMNEWDGLSVFGGFSSAISRDENDFPRRQLARMFSGYSKGNQRYLLPELTRLSFPPILYISGQLDGKYKKIGNELASACENISHISIPDACHRVPWENTADFIKSIQYFIDSVH